MAPFVFVTSCCWGQEGNEIAEVTRLQLLKCGRYTTGDVVAVTLITPLPVPCIRLAQHEPNSIAGHARTAPVV